MITYYTAIGRLEVEKRGDGRQPTVYKEGEAHDLDVYEFCIWSLLSSNIRNYDELKRQYQQKRQELRLFDDRPLDNVLTRLERRGLTASGMAYTAQDAMYELICKLRIHPLRIPRLEKFLAFILLIFKFRMPLEKAIAAYKPYPLSDLEKHIINLTGRILLTPAELIKCMEKGVVKMPSEEHLIDVVYQEEFTYKNLHNDTRFSKLRTSVMKAVVDLYLNKQIIFE